MYRVYYGPHLKGVWPTPAEAIRHAKRLFFTRDRGLPIRISTPFASIKYPMR